MHNDSKERTPILSPIESMNQEALSVGIADLKRSEGTWKTAKILAGSLAALLAVFVGIFEILENRSESQKELAQASAVTQNRPMMVT
jgi:hypothetical protein